MKKKLDKTSGFSSYTKDQFIDNELEKHFAKYKISKLEIIKNFSSLIRRSNLKRFLLHTELFKKINNRPGDIAEFGVYRGLGLMTWANLLECYSIGNRTKIVFGFDNWKGFEKFTKYDGKQSKNSGKIIGGFNPTKYKDELNSAIKIFDHDRFIGWKPRIRLIDGDVTKTFKKFLKTNPGVRFSLVHFDMDLFKPTSVVLNLIYPRVVRGGIILFDEYGIHNWPGETKAVDDFLKKHKKIKLECSNWTNTPAAWFEKKD